MKNNASLTKEVEELKLLKNMVKVYGAIATSRIKNSREEVLSAREYARELHQVAQDVYNAQTLMSGTGKSKSFDFLPQNGRRARVFVAARTRLYGGLVRKVFSLFVRDFNPLKDTAVIIGPLGKTIFETTYPNIQYDYVDISDFGINPEELTKLSRLLRQFQEIYIYHGEYRNTLLQEAVVFELKAENDSADQSKTPISEFSFEPSLEVLATFFDTEIFKSLFSQVLSEGQLAKQASRLVAMDNSEQHISERLKKVQLIQMSERQRQRNEKQLNQTNSIISRLRA